MKAIVLFTVLLSIAAGARTELSGTIAGRTFTTDGNPHIVTDNLTVGAGGKTIIEEGCVFLFKPFTGLVVDGSLRVEGTLENPVVFTTIHDSAYGGTAEQLPNPFDWNGILITPNATDVKLSNFVLAYSVYGVKSQKETFVINNGTFRQNGQFHVTVSDKIKPVVDGMPYTYNAATVVPPEAEPPETVQPQAVQPAVAPLRRGKAGKVLPIMLIGAGAIAGGLTAFPLSSWAETSEAYENERSVAVQAELKDEARTDMTTTLVLGGVSLIAIPTGIVWYVRRKRQRPDNARVSMYPVITTSSTGARLLINL